MLQLTHCEIDKDFSLKAAYDIGQSDSASPHKLYVTTHVDSSLASLTVSASGQTTEESLDNMAEKNELLAALIRQRVAPIDVISTYAGTR